MILVIIVLFINCVMLTFFVVIEWKVALELAKGY